MGAAFICLRIFLRVPRKLGMRLTPAGLESKPITPGFSKQLNIVYHNLKAMLPKNLVFLFKDFVL